MNQPAIERILELFEEISAIPRCSKNETAIAAWLMNRAAASGFYAGQDHAGNVVIRVPGSSGNEALAPVVLQGHMDMVCEKEVDSDHDFEVDPIVLVRAGDWLSANKTTLGADNGIAIAMALAMAEDKSLVHPPLELLFTVDEETGLYGAQGLRPDFIEGRTLLNIDSEDEGVFTIGCAGGRGVITVLPASFSAPETDMRFFTVTVSGLRGGHSGVDIDKKRGNANKLLARTLSALRRDFPIRLAEACGGSAPNAIARDAVAVIALAGGGETEISQRVSEVFAVLRSEYETAEPELSIRLTETAPSPKPMALTTEDTERCIDLLLALPHGVAGFAEGFDDLVETSVNLATLCLDEKGLRIHSKLRSSVLSRMNELTEQIRAAATLAGASCEEAGEYPGWRPDWNSKLLARCQKSYATVFGCKPKVEAIHAGLECGIIGSKFPGMEMISFGPTIENPHSPHERLHIPAVGKVWQFMVALLAALA